MEKKTQKRYSTELKAKVVEEILKEEKTVGQLVAEYGVPSTTLNQWSEEALTQRHYAVERYIIEHFYDFYPGGLSFESRPGEVDFMIQGGYSTSNLAMIAKKATLYSSKTYFVAGSIDRTLVGGEPDSNGVEPMILNFDSVLERHVAVLMPYLEDGCIELFVGNSTRHAEETTHADISSALRVQFHRDYVMEQMTEKTSGLTVLLPHLVGISPNTLLQVRDEYHEQFRDFQAALSRLLQGRVDDGERLLYELMQEVDHQVRTIDQEMKQIRRKKWFETMKLGIVPFPLVLALAFPTGEVIHAVVEMLGAGTLLSYVNSLRDIHEDRLTLEQNPFYIAWRLTQK